jgi:DNA-binding LacI/PurR family transcriptional regulator
VGAHILLGKHKRAIGVTVAVPMDVSSPGIEYFSWLFGELVRIFGHSGELITYDVNPLVEAGGSNYARGLWQQLYKALIVLGPIPPHDAVIERVHASGAPYLTTLQLDGLPEISCAGSDLEEAAHASMRHLLTRGHRRTAMFAGFEGLQPGIDRLRGWRRALQDHGASEEHHRFLYVPPEPGLSPEAAAAFEDHAITGYVHCSGALSPEGFLRVAADAGRHPGEDFEYVGWYYVKGGNPHDKASAAVRIPLREALSEGLPQFAQWMRGERQGPVRVLLQPELHVQD